MQIVIDIDEKDYNDIMFDVETSPRLLNRYEWLIAHGRPIQSAHWILYRDYENMIDYPQCDNCDTVIKLPLPIDNLNFCPNCGRIMEGE